MARLESASDRRSLSGMSRGFLTAVRLTAPSLLFLSAHATAQTLPPSSQPLPPQRLGVFVGTGYLGSPGLSGLALAAGLRFLPIRHLAVSFDLGYGVEGRVPDVQDRWWLMPSAALVGYAGPVQLDFGAGIGLAAASGYSTWSDYVAAPFGPIWAYQLVPGVRAHVIAATKFTDTINLFVRIDVAALVLDGNSLGSRVAIPHPGAADTTWYSLLAGAQFRLL